MARLLAGTLLLASLGCGALAPDADAGATGDAGDAGHANADGGGVYHDMTTAAFWSTFDLAAVDPNARGFAGGSFDGRFVYFAPRFFDSAIHNVVTRYDTTASFGSVSSWSLFDTQTIDSNAVDFIGSAFDGRYAYFVPFGYGTPATRYDTQAGFSVAASWTTFDTTTVNVKATGFAGAAFDGRYMYFVPDWGEPLDIGVNGTVARFDKQSNFDSSAAWLTFDTTTLDPLAKGFTGAVFDGRYVYFVPYFNAQNAGDGLVARYDTNASFGTPSSWSIFDTTTLDPSTHGFVGAAFDGRYVYLVPYDNAVVARYDTQATFGTPSSWSMFDMASINANAGRFTGAGFDGRYVYFIPHRGAPNDIVARCDITASFTDSAAWTTFEMTKIGAGANGFWGAVFDGRYMYLVPSDDNGIAVRFDARNPPSMPKLPAWSGSFF